MSSVTTPSVFKCAICLEQMNEVDLVDLPKCSHKEFHKSCLEKHFKPECPLCRKPHNIPVTGEIPREEDFNNDLVSGGRATPDLVLSPRMITSYNHSQYVNSFVREIIDEYDISVQQNPVAFSGYEYGDLDREFVHDMLQKQRHGQNTLFDSYVVAVAIKRAKKRDVDIDRLPGFDEDGSHCSDDSDCEREYSYDHW